jgi:hypothetical protein
MSGDRSDGKNDRESVGLSAEMVDEIKRRILFGDVGYKRPPVSGQFKKGQSGNPKGRPKEKLPLPMSDRSANALVLKSAERPVTVREGTEHRQVPAIDAVILAQVNTAIRGNAYAQKHYIERYDRAELERRQKDAEKIKLWTDYKTRQLEAHAEAKRKGESPPAELPHPDDVLIDEKGVRFLGPTDEEGLRRLQETLQYRDALFLQDALDERQGEISADGAQSSGSGSALLLLAELNKGVPARFRLSEDEIQFRALRYSYMPKRQLLKQTYAALRAAGIPARRGARLPPLHVTKVAIEAIYDCFGSGFKSEDDRNDKI